MTPMFGESESESPRVPSPWDSLISLPSSSLSIDHLPRLVPENDDGNVEYKLQLLSPSPARFARLVTQLKWRLLEGGGQAYYELGVADSGALVGLPRAELEQSLETLEMMAGEIGASVIVVKEIEVPAAMAGLAASQTDKWNGARKQRLARPGSEDGPASFPDASTSTETESTTTTDFDDDDDDYNDMSSTVVLERSNSCSPSIFVMDLESDSVSSSPSPQPQITIDLEIASVFKPRPMRARMQMHADIHSHYVGPTKTKRLKKIKHITNPDGVDAEANNNTNNKVYHHSRDPGSKAFSRRQVRDRKREEKRRALIAYATSGSVITSATDIASPSPSPGPVPLTGSAPTHTPTPSETDALVSGLAALHVSVEVDSDLPVHVPASKSDSLADTDTFLSGPLEDDPNDNDGDDVFSPPKSMPNAPTFKDNGNGNGSRLIVEALVVRKMSLDEAFLDFGGFTLT
ncbi:hypothetical protein H0H93_007449 [Arthromyces matolae]|nr:hypothetical protein H0H93_007449 [Arthromyces matolae]